MPDAKSIGNMICRPMSRSIASQPSKVDYEAYRQVLQRLTYASLMPVRQFAAKALVAFIPASDCVAETLSLADTLRHLHNLNQVEPPPLLRTIHVSLYWPKDCARFLVISQTSDCRFVEFT